MKVICITQARMGSTRLPGKVLKQIEQRPLIAYHIERVKNSKLIDHHIIATTNSSLDVPLVEYCKQHKQQYYLGDEHNVLERFYQCAIAKNAQPQDIIVRLTGDCPLICSSLIDQAISTQLSGASNQYTHISLDYFPRGFDVEVFSMKMLTDAFKYANSAAEKEHVTLYLYSNPSTYNIVRVIGENKRWSKFRLCVDELDDFILVTALIKRLGNRWQNASPEYICNILLNDNQLAKINANVIQHLSH